MLLFACLCMSSHGCSCLCTQKYMMDRIHQSILAVPPAGADAGSSGGGDRGTGRRRENEAKQEAVAGERAKDHNISRQLDR